MKCNALQSKVPKKYGGSLWKGNDIISCLFLGGYCCAFPPPESMTFCGCFCMCMHEKHTYIIDATYFSLTKIVVFTLFVMCVHTLSISHAIQKQPMLLSAMTEMCNFTMHSSAEEIGGIVCLLARVEKLL